MQFSYQRRHASIGGPGRKRRGFRVGDIDSRMSGSGGMANSFRLGKYTPIKLARPTFAPIDMSGIATLQGRIKDSDRTASDPLSAPGVQQQLTTISEGLNRQFQAQQGDAMSRAAQSGQAGFGGAFAQTSANLQGNLASTKAQTQSDMMMEVYSNARAEGLSATEALAQAQGEVARIQNERTRIEADTASREAEINAQREGEYLRQQDAWRNNLIQQAQLAEQARQFEIGAEFEDDKFGYKQFQDEREHGFKTREEERQRRLDEDTRRRQAQQDETAKRLEETTLLGGLHDKELLEDEEYVEGLDDRYPNLSLGAFGSLSAFGGGRKAKRWRKEDDVGSRGFRRKRKLSEAQ